MPFYIQTQNGTIIEYKLTIYIMSNDTSLEHIKINGINASKMLDGTYYVHIDALGEEVEINAKATDPNANIRIDSEIYENQETTKNKLIDAKETIVYIYVKAEDGKQTVAKYLEQVSKEVGTAVSIKKFIRFETGEGIEKKSEDFAAEVAAQMNA